MEGDGELHDSVILSIPRAPMFLRVARSLTSSVGALSGLDTEAVDDLRLAVDELCSVLLDEGRNGFIDLRFDVDEAGVRVRGRSMAGPRQQPEHASRALGRRVLAAVVEGYELGETEGHITFSLEKHRASDRGV